MLKKPMVYKKGDIVAILQSNENGESKPAVIIQADWFNLGKPPSYIVCMISSKVYPELDFRPVIKPDNKNCLSVLSQITIDKILTIKSSQISKKNGEISKQHMKEIHGCLKAILGL
ncbi:MAG TPA: type II toxin-antitoxin system PemK/MazF family toxin [Aquella sp.]|nr:type II toxin-antitoxin system PemK/MazF family toxin [Aquella sp.]